MSTFNVRNIYDALWEDSTPGEYPLNINFSVPSSKLITLEALILASLSIGECHITHMAKGEEIDSLVSFLSESGFNISVDASKRNAVVLGQNTTIPGDITPVSGNDLLSEVSMLLSSIYKGELDKSEITLDFTKESTKACALLCVSPLLATGFTIKSASALTTTTEFDITLGLVEKFGIILEEADNGIVIKENVVKAIDYDVEPDMRAACFIYAMAPLLGVPASVNRIGGQSIQGDFEFINVLYQMGCNINIEDGLLTVYPPENNELIGVVVNMASCPNQAVTLAALACFANRPSMITGLDSLKTMEVDYVEHLVFSLKALGINASSQVISDANLPKTSAISIYPGTPTFCEVDALDNPYFAMSFALLGLRSGLSIKGYQCADLLFPSFFEAIDALTSQLLD